MKTKIVSYNCRLRLVDGKFVFDETCFLWRLRNTKSHRDFVDAPKSIRRKLTRQLGCQFILDSLEGDKRA